MMMHRPDEILVRFSAVEKSYDGEVRVVESLDLDVRKGEFLTLLGPSGSGKTTTLMMLAGFEHPTSGRITLGDVDVTALPPHKRGIGVVFQNYALFPHMSVAENVAYPLKVRGVSAEERRTRVAQALASVRLDGFAERRPAQLSGGQQQRAALARALVFRPELVLLDEPLGALDRQLREELQIELKRLHRELGVTMVYVTHDQSEALTMSDRVAVFHRGRIQQIATPQTIYDEPENAFVAGFLGENNLLPASVVSVEGGRGCLLLADGTEIRARAHRELRGGTKVTLAVRPEAVRLIGPADASYNSLAGRLREKIYLGDSHRLIVDGPGGAEVSLRVDRLSCQTLPAIGSTIRYGWKEADGRTLLSAD